jgi:predicted MFS family arabinose efflux permease
VPPTLDRARPILAGAAVIAAALAVELVDELAGGAKAAALPLIRRDLVLSYGQIGLLESVPLLLGSLLELPLGILAGHGRRRRVAVLLGGVVFILSLAGAAAARSFAGLLVAFVVFFPASGAFVSLTQSGLMDADPARREQHMARWGLAGSVGSVAGPALLIAVLAAGGGWRSAYLVLALVAAAAWLGVARNPPQAAPADARPDQPATTPADARPDQPATTPADARPDQPGTTPADARPDQPATTPADARPDQPATTPADARPDQPATTPATHPNQPGAIPAARRLLAAPRRPGVLRWLVLLQVSDLLLDVFTGFLALYLVAVVHATPAQAALAVAIRLGAGLAGDAALIRALRHAGGLRLLRASAATAAVAFPGFLLVPGLWPKLVLLACVSVITAPWYPVLQAQLYGSLPDQSGVVVSLSSAAGLLGGAAPLAIGLLAQRFGLAWALAGLAIAPLCLLGGLWRSPSGAGHDGARPGQRAAVTFWLNGENAAVPPPPG